MKTITQGDHSYLTGDNIADAVLHYSLALIRRHDVDNVEVPFVDEDGIVRRVRFTIGRGTSTASVSSDSPRAELLAEETVLDLVTKANDGLAVRALPFTDSDRDVHEWSYVDDL
jgi:hypothetical protein